MIVMKFGGTSVESAEAIERVAAIVKSRRDQAPIVVVSAMAKVTDQLVAIGQNSASGDCDSALELFQSLRQRHFNTANDLLGQKRAASLRPKLETHLSDLEKYINGLAAVRELTPRGSDYLLSFGELLSSLIVADAFAVRGLESAWVDSRNCLVTNATHTRALPQMEETRAKCKKKSSASSLKKARSGDGRFHRRNFRRRSDDPRPWRF
jgi:aspartate kinase